MTPQEKQAQDDRRLTQQYIDARIVAGEEHSRSAEERQHRLGLERENDPA